MLLNLIQCTKSRAFALCGVALAVNLFGACAQTQTPDPTPIAEPAPPTAPATVPVVPNIAAPAATLSSPKPIPNLGGPNYDLPLKLPGPAIAPKISSARDFAAITRIQNKQKRFPTYEAWRDLADIYLKGGVFSEAARCRRAEAAMYRAQAAASKDAGRIDGLINAALVQENEAARYETSVQIYQERQATPQEVNVLYSGATLEPIVGCYLGAFIDRDDALRDKFFDENWQEHRTPEEFQAKTGVNHASLFMYVRYGQKFPATWIARCKKANVIPHIAWEPKDLKAVNEDAYLRGWAQSCRAADWPIFIRFAGEMNGFWTPYHANPSLYRDKFRLVHRALKKAAPRVATIWCVNSVPSETVARYYPGDDGCDWVGINLYSVPFYDNNPQRPALLDNPTTLIEPIYNLYAKRKPIAICEYGASHMAVADHRLRVPFAIDKMAQLYTSLPTRFPRIKLIDWFSMNTMKYAMAGRQLNNYQLTESPDIIAGYRQIASSPYFLGGPEHLSDARPPLPFAVVEGQKIRVADAPGGVARFVLCVKTYVPRPKVYLQVNGKLLYAANRPGAHTVALNLKSLAPGAQTLTVLLYDDKNRFITQTERHFVLAP